jgi:peroxiredoxin Q/BCP
LRDFDANLSQFEAANAQVVGVSADHVNTLQAFTDANKIRYPLLSDFSRKMLPAYGAMVTDEQSPIYRYAKRAYFILDRQGIVRYMKIQDNALDILTAEEILKALKESGA